jgi:hypothetical protein
MMGVVGALQELKVCGRGRVRGFTDVLANITVC